MFYYGSKRSIIQFWVSQH